MTHLSKNTNAAYNFIAPEIEADANKKIEVPFPTAEGMTVEVVDGVIEIDIKRDKTIISIGAPLEESIAVVLNKLASVGVGAIVVLGMSATGGSRTVEFAGDVIHPDLIIPENKYATIMLICDGEKFYPANLSPAESIPGASILSGEGVPDVALGNDGDHYLDTLTYDLYQKLTGAWGVVGNIKGADGADGSDGSDGANGSTILSGEGVPDVALGNDFDHYIDTLTYDLYQKLTGAWSVVGNIKGADGADGSDGSDGMDGANGSTILSGEGVPDVALGNDFDHYIDTLTYDLYHKLTGAWGVVGNIKGADGAALTSDQYVNAAAEGELSHMVDHNTTVIDLTLANDTVLTLSEGASVTNGSLVILKATLNAHTLTGMGMLAGKTFTEVSGVVEHVYVLMNNVLR